LISSVPWNAVPLPVYHSHSVDIVNGETADSKALRVTLFSQMNVQEAMAGITGQPDGGVPLRDLGRGTAKFEIPFSVSDLTDPAFRLTADKLKFKIEADGKVNVSALEAAKEAIAQMNPMRAFVQSVHNAGAQFFRGFDLTLNFGEIAELMRDVPDFVPPPAAPAVGGPARLRVRRGPNAQPSGMQQMKMGLNMIAGAPIAEEIARAIAPVAGLVQQSGQTALYEAVRNNVIGLGRIHVQAHDMVLRIGFKGLDVIQLLPPLN